ncbi:MAG: mhpC [Ramlibacter sp.]|uniref:alpha/beta fold hydrolase n=1 Tax=Ramlibacter sp. TaxID=1917967 RepID=UPI002601E530|nr:alpha/beta hydrolase [Ramlibacter sp.]MDB5750417.1 mhpC [Ramlibacter sp.]
MTAAFPPPSSFVEIDWAGRPARIEHQWVGSGDRRAPLLVFLHEGLGSVAMWRDFPARLCDALGAAGLVYSRPGYGRSTPRAEGEQWGPDFMHRQADEVLPALLRALGIEPSREELWLFGHSDGASIALLYAAHQPGGLQGAIVLAPHILVEDVSIDSIAQARAAWRDGDLRERLARYHDEPASAFEGWNGAWLNPAFRAWSIEQELDAIRCPVLAVQGLDDEYGTLEQVRGIASRVPGTELLELPACGHSPHRDQPQLLLERVASFVRRHRRGR